MSNKNSDVGLKILKNLQKRKTEKRIGWGPVAAVFVTLSIYFGAQILAGYFIFQYLFATGTSQSEIIKTIDNSIVLQFSFLLIAQILSLLFLWLFMRYRHISWQQIGLKKPSFDNLLYSLPAYAVYFILFAISYALVNAFVPGVNVDQEQQVGFEGANGAVALSFVFVALVVLPAVVEEIMVRGFLYGGLRNKLPKIKAAIVASLIFGAAHLQLGSGEIPLWIAAVDTFILSMVLIWLREKTGNIWAGVAVHMIKNSLAFISLFIIKTI